MGLHGGRTTFFWSGVETNGKFGNALGTLGDVNGDGLDEYGVVNLVGSNFGWALAAGDYDGFGTDDLAVGIDESDTVTGRTQVFYGEKVGIKEDSPNELWDVTSPNVDGSAGDPIQFGGLLR